jgi:hypothetical protein
MADIPLSEGLRKIAAEIRALPAMYGNDAEGNGVDAAGERISDAHRLGAFEGNEPTSTCVRLSIQEAGRRFNTGFDSEDLAWKYNIFVKAAKCVAPELFNSRVAHRDAFQIACSRLADAIDAEAERLAEAEKAKRTTPPAAKPEQGEGDGGKAPNRSRKGKGGKAPLSKAEEKERLEMLRDWWQAQEAGVKRKDFCRDKGIPLKTLKRYVNWHGTRRIRDTN